MPKPYEYFGLVVLFYANEHEPVHVHGKYHERESRAEIFLENGEIIKILITPVKYKRPLEGKPLRDFTLLVEHYAHEIVQKWVEFFVYNQEIHPETITRRITP